jgi:PTH1 family peptidyl-tRNA hydrolase
MIELVCFLGNPGAEYSGNRHNAGWLLALRLPFYNALAWRDKFRGRYAEMDGGGFGCFAEDASEGREAAAPKGPAESPAPAKIRFLLPGTYMNLSGDSAAAAASFFKIPPERILAVHDELELPLGTISLKFSGGLGGHNGLRSFRAKFGTPDFWRIRIGIGRPGDRLPGQGGPPGSGRGIADWVLSDFDAAELPVLEPALDAAAVLLVRALASDPRLLLPEWGKKKIAP